MKYKLLVASVALATAQVQAGGFENARLDTSFMYDEGNLVSFGTSRRDFDVKGSVFGTTESLVGDRSASNFSVKFAVDEELSVGFSAYDSGAIHLNYQGAGIDTNTALYLASLAPDATAALAGVNAAGPKVNLTADSIAFLANYKFSDHFSVLGGLRHDKYDVADGDIFGLGLVRGGAPMVSSASDTVPVFAIAYSRPDIALRVELLHQGKASVEMATTCAAPVTACAPGDSTGGLAQFTTLNFQSGIAQDTLVFGSLHKGKWSDSQLSVSDIGVGSFAGPTSAFEDSTEYTLGLAHRINEAIALSIAYNWEKAGDGTTGSLFTLNDGYKGITLGARYTIDDVELSVGYNRTKLGKVTYNGLNELSGNTVTAIGAKATLRF